MSTPRHHVRLPALTLQCLGASLTRTLKIWAGHHDYLRRHKRVRETDGTARLFLGYDRLAELAGYSRRTAIRHTQLLCELGYMRQLTQGAHGTRTFHTDGYKVPKGQVGLASVFMFTPEGWRMARGRPTDADMAAVQRVHGGRRKRGEKLSSRSVIMTPQTDANASVIGREGAGPTVGAAAPVEGARGSAQRHPAPVGASSGAPLAPAVSHVHTTVTLAPHTARAFAPRASKTTRALGRLTLAADAPKPAQARHTPRPVKGSPLLAALLDATASPNASPLVAGAAARAALKQAPEPPPPEPETPSGPSKQARMWLDRAAANASKPPRGGA